MHCQQDETILTGAVTAAGKLSLDITAADLVHEIIKGGMAFRKCIHHNLKIHLAHYNTIISAIVKVGPLFILVMNNRALLLILFELGRTGATPWQPWTCSDVFAINKQA